MAYIPESNSVVAFQSDPTKLVGTVSVVSTAPSSVMVLNPVSTLAVNPNPSSVYVINPVSTITISPPANQSVSGTVGASVIGHAPVVIVGGSILTSSTPNQSVSGTVDVGNFPAVQVVAPNNSSMFAFQKAGSILAVSGSFTPAANQSVSGTVQVDVRGSVATVIIGGSIATSSPANQSVSGTVGASIIGTVPVVQSGVRITSVISSTPSSMLVGASIIGLTPVAVSNFPATQPISGSVAVLQGTDPWTVKSSLAGGIFPVSGSVAAVITNTNVNVSGSVVAFGFPTNQNVSGSVVAFQGAGWSGSVAATVVNFPTTQNVSGSVVAFQQGTQSPSVYGMRNDTLASFLGANLTTRPMAVDSAGRTLTKPFSPEESRVEGYHSVVSTSVTTLVAAAGAGLRNYITDVMIANTGATTALITFKDGAGSILGYTIAPSGGGSNLPGLATPIRTGANASFDFQPDVASSIIFATVKGFKGP